MIQYARPYFFGFIACIIAHWHHILYLYVKGRALDDATFVTGSIDACLKPIVLFFMNPAGVSTAYTSPDAYTACNAGPSVESAIIMY